MTEPHEPTPEFLAHLARETRYALRAGSAPHRPALRRGGAFERLRVALVAALSLGAGAGLVVASERAQDARRTELALAANQVRVDAAARRAEALRASASEARSRHAAGISPTDVVDEADLRVADAVRRLAHAELEREALRLGGPALRWATTEDGQSEVACDLDAPRVGVRDFVSEHLLVDRAALLIERDTRAAQRQRSQLRFESGFTSSAELESADATVKTLEARLAGLDGRIALRADFLLGRVTGDTLVRAELRLAAESRRAAAALRVESLRRSLARAERLTEAGLAPAPLQLQLELSDAEAAVALAALELEALE
ncbi:MAG: hypothetical protein R3F49_21420 [Planctomycetota bacterium]